MTTLSARSVVLDLPNCSLLPMSFEMKAGEVWGLLGPNGVGKTTLLHTLANLRKWCSGNIYIDQARLQDIHRLSLAQKVGVLFQEHQDGLPATVMETVLLGRFPYSASNWKNDSRQDQELTTAALEALSLQSLSDRSLHQLSGGERQRTAIAALYAQAPDIWLVDEPTNHLDLHHQVEVMSLLSQQAKEGRVMIMSLHDLNLAARWCSHVMLMYPDRPMLAGQAQQLLTLENLEPLYQQKLVQGEIDGQTVFMPSN